jgi:hypothetical protein
MRYTDYLLPSGTGTRIVTYAAPPFRVETGDPLPDEVLGSLEPAMSSDYAGQIDTLVEMANAAADTVAAV